MTRSALLDQIGKLLERDSDRVSTARALVDAIDRRGPIAGLVSMMWMLRTV